ncbi:hypothetical protein ACIOG4_28650 [Streptomyces microflavus]|uniref:hypothetical protein n=1 Tax=Streptomyces microflavus TaxID=1919 RepID=UPI0037F629B0
MLAYVLEVFLPGMSVGDEDALGEGLRPEDVSTDGEAAVDARPVNLKYNRAGDILVDCHLAHRDEAQGAAAAVSERQPDRSRID